jgi:E3 ubiquitin-protein ligase RNFT1
MDPPAGGSADRRGNGPGAGAALSGLRRYGLNFSASSLLQAPIAALLEYSGVVPSGSAPQPVHPSVAPSSPSSSSSEVDGLLSAAAAGDGEVSIQIQGGSGDPEAASGAASSPEDSIEATAGSEVDQASSVAGRGGGGADAEANGGTGGGTGAAGNGAEDRAYQRYDVHHVARWIEQILPFSLLLLVVFIRQHLQGLCIFLSFSKYCNAVRLKHPCVQIFYLVRLLNKPRSLE